MDAALRDLLVRHAAVLGADLKARMVEQIEAYLGLLRIWNRTTRLTGPTDDRALVERHVLDSLAVAPQLAPGARFIDVGSGAGFPGLVLAIARPESTAFLVEARRRRASFLAEASRSANLKHVTVICARAEALQSDPRLVDRCDVAVSRAVRADDFLPLAAPFLRRGGVAVVMQTDQQAKAPAPAASPFEGAGQVDYRLPGGVSRRLLLYRRVC